MGRRRRKGGEREEEGGREGRRERKASIKIERKQMCVRACASE